MSHHAQLFPRHLSISRHSKELKSCSGPVTLEPCLQDERQSPSMDTVSDGHRQKPQPQSTSPILDLTTGRSLSLLSHGPSQHCSAAAPAYPLPPWSQPPACMDQLCSPLENKGQTSRQHVLVHPSNSRRYWECLLHATGWGG